MRVAVAQFYTKNVSYGKFSESINKKYCEDNGYYYLIEDNTEKITELTEDRSFTWVKPKFLLEILERKEHDYILFLDIDAIVCDNSRRIEEFIDEKYDIVATEDYSHHSLMNAGVLLIKNSEWSRQFMKDWWDSGNFLRGVDAPELNCNNEEPGYFKGALWHDQTCLTYLYKQNRKDHIKIIPYRDMNWREYKEGNFIFHAFAYGSLKNRKLDTAYYEIFNITPDLKNKTLVEMCEYYTTDKEYEHNYISNYYEDIFHPIKETAQRFCEIGYGYKGELASARLWREYFTNSKIIICEPNIKKIEEDRIELFELDQSNEESLEKFFKSQENFDVILDDGSHKIKDQQITFAKLFKKLSSGGVYIIEDLHTSIEAKMPEKAAFNWGDPNKTTTLEMLENLEKTEKITSDYISVEDKDYIEKNLEMCRVLRKSDSNWSITSIIKKK
jgi:hypothetical protein